MYRFVAVLGDPSDPDSDPVRRRVEAHIRSTGAAWRTAYEGDRLTVWQAGESDGRMEARALGDGAGIVLGQLFRKARPDAPSSPARALSAAEAEKCVASRGRHLIDHYWGRYVAFLDDRYAGATHVVRDPSAALPCYMVEHGSSRLFFSDIADVARLPFLRFRVNYDYLAANALLPQYQKTITGLEGVGEILPAQSVTLGPEGDLSMQFLWDPYAVAETDPIHDPGAACRLLRDAVIDSTHALGRSYERVLSSVGGLDSSIVLSCLAGIGEGTAVTCMNLSTTSPKGDESYYAGKAAAHAGTPFMSGRLDPGLVDLRRMTRVDPQPSPMIMFDCTSPAGQVYERAGEVGAEALFYGLGGDNVFFQINYILSALDYVRSGIGRSSLPRVAMEAARYGNRSLAVTLLAMAREWRKPEPGLDYVYRLVSPSNRRRFLDPDLVARGPDMRLLHPRLLANSDPLKGKCAHVLASAFFAVPYYDHWRPDGAIERICPLLSQPVVELCLRIPTWNMVSGGVDRGLARKAFAGMLPPEVLHRTSKSSPDDLYEAVYERNRELIRETLLEGELVRRGILVRAELEELLRGPLPRSVGPGLPLEFLSWEMWVQRWRNFG